MKYLIQRNLYYSVILLGLLCSESFPTQEAKLQFREERTVFSCMPGQGPGQYYYWRGAGYNLFPRCFAIDPNDGAFYIPEVDPANSIRVHKFDPNGMFIKMVDLKGKVEGVYSMMISSGGDIYLAVGRLTGAGVYICRYDSDDNLLSRFGTQGPITEQELKRDAEPYSEKYFHAVFSLFTVVNGELWIVQPIENGRTIHKFDSVSGRLLGEGCKLPDELEIKMHNYHQMLEALRKAPGERRIITHNLIGPDGQFYYMRVKPEKLEIHKVTFQEE